MQIKKTMASLSLKVQPGSPNFSGYYPIFVAVSHNKDIRFSPTPYDVPIPSQVDIIYKQ